MHSTSEELLLLLKKWESESKIVIASGLIQPPDGFRCVMRVSGLVRVDEAAATFSIGELSDSFALCHISYLGMGYSLASDLDDESFDPLLDRNELDEIICIRNPDLSTLTLFTLISN